MKRDKKNKPLIKNFRFLNNYNKNKAILRLTRRYDYVKASDYVKVKIDHA
jgi:hypothetical protein